MKQTVKLTESKLRSMIKTTISEALDEMGLLNKKTGKVHTFSYDYNNWAPDGDEWKWKWSGDKVDKYMWRIKKLAEKQGKTGPNGWPIGSFFNKYAQNHFAPAYDEGFEELPLYEDDYEIPPEQLYRGIDALIYFNELAKERQYEYF